MEHMVIDIVGGHEDGDTIVINMDDVTKGCLTCRGGMTDPATCPLNAPTGVEWQAGDFIVTGRDGEAVRLTSIDRWTFTYECRDGHRELQDFIGTREEYTARWRRATDEEIATFVRLYRPAPQNWN